MESTLTIIKSTKILASYPITYIPPDVLDLLQRAYADTCREFVIVGGPHILKALDAFFHVTGFQLSYLTLSTPSFETAARAIMEAIFDRSICPGSLPTRRSYIRFFLKLLDKMRTEVPLLPVLTSADTGSSRNRAAWELMKKNINPKALRYRNGWEVKRRQGKFSFLPIPLIWNSHGEEFAELIYEKYRQNAEKQQAPVHVEFNLWLKFISENSERWPASTLQHPIKIRQHFTEFMLYYFHRQLEYGNDIYAQTKSYSRFINTIEETFIDSGIWTRPFSGGLPRPPVKSTPGAQTNIKKREDGALIKDKLITEVPINLSDDQAIEILFKKIRADNTLVLDWAKLRLSRASLAHANCQALAQNGKIITNVRRKEKRIEAIGIENICATYQQMGVSHMQAQGCKIMGAVSRLEIVELLGIPTIDTLFAFQLLLTHAHPSITESFFTNFQLYDKHGNLSGFLETDTGRQLVGYKNRKGGALSEQKINLTPEQAGWVDLIVSLTSVLRKELKERGDDAWRYLFLHTRGRISSPIQPLAMTINNQRIDHHRMMIREFMEVGNLTEAAAKQFMIRLSVTAFRASAAVEVYLNTHSVEQMASSLGHTAYSASLLSRYLPEPILAFFQTRWARTFQRGIICKAMKDSPHLLEAAHFKNMDELHDFLDNHSLRDIPQHLQNPDYLKPKKLGLSEIASDERKADRVIVSIDTGVLTALLSLKSAVDSAGHSANLCGKAIYWTHFTNLIIQDIKEGFNSDLHEYLDFAQEHANASQMERLIYATTT
ncbi:hypothetical protein M2D07_004510 [Pseudomonas sp. BGr12]|uniref:hypothetical protein n=1 Tax=Pseudomonas sp. BGr12 TaxID=2936269 RepID=UPI002559F327|nr:hypothetical protein [Pseudomonas sp. BJa5]MDL2426275.1 hypothetical protein [Pseudomonas sp. BJa5]